ncbi:redox-sensing transcriptional repressor Rex [uncultured Tyzzerella sp.]|uniref:redox-sensing transcriptional repressor Rex n=1 Tax=uncultured Tyzzerella sp. TaxID=2321398 RepID=UPI002943BAAD|nr:redox-sensing transcriptional repressor Rex [uncultured Tyzzerella sp.]
MDKKVSLAVIKRLPRYYRFLGNLLDDGITRISSKDLSQKMNVTASQIRQDLNNFGCFGQQGYGYNVELLYEEIKEILGLNKTYNLVILGAGKIGQALLNYVEFEKRGFNFIGIFDVNSDVIGTKIRDLEVKDIIELEQFTKDNIVDIAVLAVPGTNAYDLYKNVVSYGIKGIWNFSNTELTNKDGVIVENVHLTDSLMTLAYKFNSNDFIED